MANDSNGRWVGGAGGAMGPGLITHVLKNAEGEMGDYCEYEERNIWK